MIEQLFTDILETQSVSGDVGRMTSLVVSYAEMFGAKVEVKDGNVYVVKGNPTEHGYPCIVSHTDTVHDILPDEQYSVGYDRKNGIIYAYDYTKRSFTGIGGDDKVGIYIALSAIRDFSSIKSVFFRDEEIGCVGSGLADMSFFSDCMYILQCDRKGNANFVNSISGIDISSKDFQDDVSDIIKKHGYEFHPGGVTDVGKLTANDVGISCANMSCGYHNPHTSEEIIDVKDVSDTKELVYEIIETLTKKYPHKPTRPKASYGTSYGKKSYAYYDDWYSTYNNPVDPHPIENKTTTIDELDWWSHMPSDKDLQQMDFDELYYHAVLLMSGWEYCGDMVYSKTDGCVTKYDELYKIDVFSIEQVLNENQLNDAFEFADYCFEYKDEIAINNAVGCISCGCATDPQQAKEFFGSCADCFSKYNEPII